MGYKPVCSLFHLCWMLVVMTVANWLRCCIGRIRCLRISRRLLVCSFHSCLSSSSFSHANVNSCPLLRRWCPGNIQHWHRCRRKPCLLVPCPTTTTQITEPLTLHRTSYLVTMVFTYITAAVVAEVCSASPSAGSIYLWAAEAGGPRFGRLFGFIVAWWSTTAWTTFCASMSFFLSLW